MRGLDSPWGLRVTGLVGVAVVAAGAYGAGALPGRDPGLGLRGPGTPGVGFWLGLTGWVVGLAILSGAWWRIGRRLDGVSSRWVLGTGALWATPLLLAPALASRDVYSYACQGEIWRSALDPYAVGAVDGGCPWVDAVPDLWQHTPAPYGPVGVVLSGLAAAVARGAGDHQLLVAVTLLRVVALIGGVLIAGYAGRLASAIGVSPVAARWLGLLSPLVAVHLVSGAHNDALTAGLIVAALAVAVPATAARRDPAGTAAAGTTARGPAVPAGTAAEAVQAQTPAGPAAHDQSPATPAGPTTTALHTQTPAGPAAHTQSPAGPSTHTQSPAGPAAHAQSPAGPATHANSPAPGGPAGTPAQAPSPGGLAAPDETTWTGSRGPATTVPAAHASTVSTGSDSNHAVITQSTARTSANIPSQVNGEQSPRSVGGHAWGAAVAAGTLLGLAVGVKVTAIIVLPFVVLLVAGRRISRGAPAAGGIARAAGVVTASGVLVFAAATLAAGLDLGWVRALSDTGSLVQWTSLPTGVGMAAGYLLRAVGQPEGVDTAVSVARAVGIAALALIALGLCWRALRATLRLREADGVEDASAADPEQHHQGAVPLAEATNLHHDHRLTDATHQHTPGPGADREHGSGEGRRQVVAAAGWSLAAAAVLLPVFYPWYALVPLAVLACATKPGRTRNALAVAAVGVTALTLPNGLGIPVLTKLPGALADVAIVAAAATYFLRRRRRNSQDEPVPATGDR
ncbi:polyprenol phosphomannose-dependent alpha 1,6 mannosyltransferase MptB [Asanoa siamensis]|uniref:Alpha-1,6-mannosyltransferase n=1 Tax=Asanoa siamensis TaxID=926357 RepID=A0ABQ4CZU4_9ACTN|nr:polyprenol phosphomannose-dependent alpha 1,6 mannosyltransferase MptB [Asanoa siamensis]GIF76790.1 hypothetical protein Asi02nite_63080 [Asanoa siamensis]